VIEGKPAWAEQFARAYRISKAKEALALMRYCCRECLAPGVLMCFVATQGHMKHGASLGAVDRFSLSHGTGLPDHVGLLGQIVQQGEDLAVDSLQGVIEPEATCAAA
jgi:hypothetical protein